MIGMLSLKIMPAYAYNADLLLINAFLWLLMFYICKPFKVLMHPALGAKQTRSLYNCCFIIMYIYSVLRLQITIHIILGESLHYIRSWEVIMSLSTNGCRCFWMGIISYGGRAFGAWLSAAFIL